MVVGIPEINQSIVNCSLTPVLGGPVRRTTARRRIERRPNPVRTARNMAFIVVTAMTFYGVAAAALLFFPVFEY